MLAISVREAIRGAVATFGRAGVSVDLPSPATPEAVFWAVNVPGAAPPTSRALRRQRKRAEMDWLAAADRLRRERRTGILVTVTEVRGHAPREAGAKMVVALPDAGPDGDSSTALRAWGTVGGGNLEQTALERARAPRGAAGGTRATHPAAQRQGTRRPRTAVLRRGGHAAVRAPPPCGRRSRSSARVT